MINRAAVLAPKRSQPAGPRTGVIRSEELAVYYGDHKALSGINMEILDRRVTALIGPSGCGKSTLLRCFNRMLDLVPTARIEGQLLYFGRSIYGEGVDPVEVRRQVGMVFQRPNPFPKSIYENVAWGVRLSDWTGDQREMDAVVERALKSAALWDEVKDKLDQSGLALSGGQQQRLCIARAVAMHPRVVLMDEPCSALDPLATMKIEELIEDLKREYAIVIVTHNMQQAARVSDVTAMMMLEPDTHTGTVIEVNDTSEIFTNPKDRRTEDYITGRYG